MPKLRLVFLLEIPIILIGLLAMDHFLLAGDRMWGIYPHPFLFVVLIASIQYGTNEGCLTAFFATLALLVGNMPEQTVSQGLYDYIFEVSSRPLLWFGSAVVFGGFTDRRQRQRRTLSSDLSNAQKQAEVFSTAYQQLDKERTRLETHLSGQSQTMLSLHRVVRNMEKLEPGKTFSNLLEITQEVMKSEKCSWFALQGTQLQMDSQSGWESDERYSQVFSSESALFREVVGRQRTLSVTNVEDQQIMENEGIMAGPLINTETGEIYGMLKIEQLDFTGLHLSSIETFKALCEWLGTHFGTVSRYKHARSEMIQNPDNKLLSKRYFEHLSDFLQHLSTRAGFESTTITVRAADGATFDNLFRREIEKTLRETVQALIRKTDLIFEGEGKELEFVLMLANTPLDKAQKVSDKLMDALKLHLGDKMNRSDFSITIGSLGEKSERGPHVQSYIGK